MQELDLLIARAKELDNRLTALDQEAKVIKQEHVQLMESEIPTTMIANNLAEYTTLGGETIKYKVDYRGSSAKDRAADIIAFLGKHGYASGYKKVIQIELPYSPDGTLGEGYHKAVRVLTEEGIGFEESTTIHFQTLQAMLRRLMPELSGSDMDTAEELLKATQYFNTTIR